MTRSRPPTRRTTSSSRRPCTVACTADSLRLVGDEHEAGVGADALLLGGADADAVVGEHAGDGVQHAGLVGDLEAEEVLGRGLVDRADAGLGERAERAVRALGQVDGGVDHVAEHGAGGRPAAGAAAVEHQLADRVALDEHGVEALAHAGQRVVHRHHRRVHAHGDLAAGVVELGDGEQLDDVAEPAGDVDVGGRDVADALVVDVAGDDLGAEGDRGDDRRLGAGVEALDVGGRVALGEPEPLRLGERLAVGRRPPRSSW